METARGICVLVFLVHTGHVCCIEDNSAVPVPDTAISSARCMSRCIHLFGDVQKNQTNRNGGENLVPECDSSQCKQCLLPCSFMSAIDDKCGTNLCGQDEPCLSSCVFLGGIRNDTNPFEDKNRSENVAAADAPTVVCKNVPYGRHNCSGHIASVYLKWTFGQSLEENVPVYIISERYKYGQSAVSDWTVKKMVTESFVEVGKLSCNTEYQFAVTAVSSDRVLAQSATTEWSKTLNYNYSPAPPRSLSVSEPYLVHQKPAVTVTWDPGTEVSCFYKIYWLGQRVNQEEIKAPRQFSHQIKDLIFSKNYTIRLFSTDDGFQHTSKAKIVYVMTPDCLVATNYNHSVCAPEKPKNLTLEVLTPFYENINVPYINVTLSWEPPDYTHGGNDVIGYNLVYRKEPPYNVARHLQPHKAELNLNGSETSVTLLDLHNHNLYSFELSAVTKGGKGDSEFIKVYIETGSKNSSTHGLFSAEDEYTVEPDLQRRIENSSSSSLTVLELMAVILVPLILFLALIAIVSFVVIRRKKKHKKYSSARKCGPVEEMNPIYDGMALNIDSDKKAQFAMDGYEIDYSCLDFISVIGEGAFGKVVKAEFYPNPGDRGNQQGKIVAVKMLRDFYTGDESRNFLLEIQAMKNLGHHPYIVSIIGCCLTGPKLCLVMDYCALGDLRNYLRRYREKLMYSMSSTYGMMTKAPNCYMQDQLFKLETQNSDGSGNADVDEATDISEAQLLSYARQITMGMEFLEQRKFVHRDLAARNILLFDHRNIKISDFGLTRDVYETNVYQPTSARKLPYKWMAIESLFSQRFTVKSDIWSFGIVLWEIVTLGGSPYPSIPLKDLYGLLNDGYRMEKPENCSTKIYQIMLSCWHPNPHSRPTFSVLRKELEKLLEETMSYIDLSVEVSEDYFNESTNESNIAGYQTPTTSKDTKSDLESTKSQEFLEEQKLLVDIHNQPQSTDLNNESSRQTLTINDSDYLESQVTGRCDTCDERRPLVCGQNSNRNFESSECSKSWSRSDDCLKGKPSHLVKSVFQDSLTDLLDNVGGKTSASRPSKMRILSRSVTNVSEGNTVQSTSL